MNPSYRVAILGWLAAFTLVAPVIAFTLPFYSVLGIPVAIFMAATPFLFLLSFAAEFSQLCGGSRIAGAGGMIALLCGAAALVNFNLSSKVNSFISGDQDRLGTTLRAQAIALSFDGARPHSQGYHQCDALCRGLLIGGRAKRVLIASAPSFADANWLS